MNMKYFVPALLAIGLISGAVFLSSDAYSWNHNGNGSGFFSSFGHNGGHNGGRSGHNGGGYHNGGGSGYNDNGYGHNGGGRNGMHRGYNLNAEDRTKYNSMSQKHQDSTQPLRSELFVKNQELQALQNAANPDVTAIKRVSNELIDINQKLRQQNMAFDDTLNKSFKTNSGM